MCPPPRRGRPHGQPAPSLGPGAVLPFVIFGVCGTWIRAASLALSQTRCGDEGPAGRGFSRHEECGGLGTAPVTSDQLVEGQATARWPRPSARVDRGAKRGWAMVTMLLQAWRTPGCPRPGSQPWWALRGLRPAHRPAWSPVRAAPAPWAGGRPGTPHVTPRLSRPEWHLCCRTQRDPPVCTWLRRKATTMWFSTCFQMGRWTSTVR